MWPAPGSPELGDLSALFRICGLSEPKASGWGLSFREVAARVAVGSPRYTARRCWVASERLRWSRRLRPARSRQEHPVGGTSDSGWAPIEHVRVDHGGADIPVAEELLDGPDVVIVFQQVGSEGVAEGVGRGRAGEAPPTDPGPFR